MAAFVAVESAHAYSAVLPSIFTIRTFAQTNGTTAKDIRDGEVIGSAFALTLGAIVSKLTSSALPLVFSAVTAAVMVGIYEWALSTAHQ